MSRVMRTLGPLARLLFAPPAAAASLTARTAVPAKVTAVISNPSGVSEKQEAGHAPTITSS